MLEHQKKEVYRIDGVTKAYGEGSAYSEVIKHVDMSVNSGDYLVLFGPSGSGKSTLLYLLAGLENPTKGSISVRGRDLSKMSNNDLATFHRISIGIVYQSFHLLPSFTILENVAFPLSLQGLRFKKRQERAMEVLQRFGIDALTDHYPSEISGGQQQKVAIARAMINMPPILLIDEPTGNLDSQSSQEIMNIINMLHKQGGRTIILVTHNPEFIKYSTTTRHIVDGIIYDKIIDIPSTYLSKIEEEEIRKKGEPIPEKTAIESVKNPFESM